MENTENIVMEDEIEFDPADFEGFDDSDGNHTDTEQPEPETQGEPETEPTTEPPQTEEKPGEGEEKPGAEPEMFELNILGNIEKKTREETIALAQQGADYARVAQQRDAFRQFQNQHGDTIAELESLAQSMNMDIPAILESMQVSLRMQNGDSREVAVQKVRAERAERKLTAQMTARQNELLAKQQEQQRQEQDIQAFIQKHPGLDPKTIHQSVWDAVRNGETLVNAYDSYMMQQMQAENKQLREQITALQQNNNNRQNSVGSVKSGGQPPKTDPFLEELFAD